MPMNFEVLTVGNFCSLIATASVHSTAGCVGSKNEIHMIIQFKCSSVTQQPTAELVDIIFAHSVRPSITKTKTLYNANVKAWKTNDTMRKNNDLVSHL